MIFSSKNNKQKGRLIIDLTLSELIEKYCGKYFINIKFQQDGVDVWISDRVCKKEGEKE